MCDRLRLKIKLKTLYFFNLCICFVLIVLDHIVSIKQIMIVYFLMNVSDNLWWEFFVFFKRIV